MTGITSIKIDGITEPTGITGPIEAGWIFESDQTDVRQISYELQIAGCADFSEPVFESGIVKAGDSNHVGIVCEWGDIRRYYLRVRALVDTAAGTEQTDWAHTTFLTGYQNIENWSGTFITAEKPEDAAESFGTYLRAEFCVEKPLRAAYLVSSAHGLYHAYINGKKAGNAEFAPGWTSYNKRLLYQTCEITDLLSEGKNAVGVHLGAGWYKGLMGYNQARNIYGDRTAFGGQIILDYTDGTREVTASGTDWKGSRSPVLFSEIYDGETYDARLEQDGWCEPGFDAFAWTPAEAVERDVHTLFAQKGCAVREITRVDAVKVFTTPEGDMVVDFGQNLAGWAHIAVEHAQPGSRVEIQYFETLDAAGNVYTENLRTAKETVVYICRGAEKEVYHPNFSYQGFRYAKIVSWPGTPKAENFTAWAVHSDLEQTGDFSCSNPLINQLQHNILWSMKGNFLDIPTDCPQRDERLGWTADAQIFSGTASFLMNIDPFMQKWLADLDADQSEEGAVPHVVPDILTGHSEGDKYMHEGAYGSSGWADASVIIPWRLYLEYGDTQVLRQQYDSIKKWIAFQTANSAEGCLYNLYRRQFGDWIALDAQEGSFFGATPVDYTCAAYYTYVTGLTAKIAAVLEKEEDAAYYRGLYEELKASFAEQFVAEDGQLTVQTQTANILALVFDLIPEGCRAAALANLKRLRDERDGHLVTGFLGTPFFARALSENGALDDAYDLLMKEDFPSWLYQVKMGATTVWEHWDGLKPDGTMWSPGMNSYNHYAYGSIGEWLYRVIGGLAIDESHPGYRHFFVQPMQGGGITEAHTEHKSIYGDIEVHWKTAEAKTLLRVKIPANTSASIRLSQAKDISDAGGLKAVQTEAGWELEAGSGEWEIRFTI